MSQNDPQAQAQALIPYTGFYLLDPILGSFVMVDTHEVWKTPSTGNQATNQYFGTITLCQDGKSSSKFALGDGATFIGRNLVIDDSAGVRVADLTFESASGLGCLGGTVHGVKVTGDSPFGPVQLSLWNGTYYEQVQSVAGKLPEYQYAAALQIVSDGRILFGRNGSVPVPVPSYWYDYGMFVIGLMDIGEPGNIPKLYEMGTSSGWGRVAGDAMTGTLLVSLQLQELAPHL